MSAADWWLTGYGHDFAQNIERIAASLERISKLMEERNKIALAALKLDDPSGFWKPGPFESPPSTEGDL